MVGRRKIAAALAIGLTFATAQAHAGGQAEPLMEPEVIAAETATSGGFVLPMILLALLVAVASGGGGGGTAPTGSPPGGF